jgi:predicted ABC-type transport system involved in lysophospholipase L1 biosynthesis ATPase subunit
MTEAPTNVLQANGLRKAYRSGPREIAVLNGVDLVLGRGETVSIRGESGSGKTTLLNLLAGIESADEGDVTWNGQSLALKEAKARAEHLLDELGLADRLYSRPEQLSGGERQRTAIARALVNSPEVLLADEPTGNLDERTAERVMEQLLAAVSQHRTALLLVTHHPGYASRTQRQFHLEEGRLVDGPLTA